MTKGFDAQKNYDKSKKQVGYINRRNTPAQVYQDLGFKSGLEIHQQLKTAKKLFCNCPAGLYQEPGQYDAEIVRHMRPTLSELGEYDGTALMEFKTRKNITYKIKNETACTYDIDDTPPFPLNRDALSIAIELALLLKTSIVGELHITRKQYLDGSIPTGFQRTAIIGINGEIPLANKNIGIIQLSVEEDSCREVLDKGHERVYTTDRLGIPLVEVVTHPHMKTPEEVAEAAHYIRFLTRSTGKVRTGIGAAREDVNVSIAGGTRIEIKGVAHIKWIPDLTHNEAFRQKALLLIKDILNQRKSPQNWHINQIQLTGKNLPSYNSLKTMANIADMQIMAINLPGFKGILSFFTQPGQCFAHELSTRLKVVACLEKPNMIHSEQLHPDKSTINFENVKKLLQAGHEDAQLIIWGPPADIKTALETIEERCLMAFTGVANETRKACPDGTTIFERVLPGPDRMYPDTDSVPIPISEEMISSIEKQLPPSVISCQKQMKKWKIPADAYTYILKKNLFPLISKIIKDFGMNPVFVATLFAHRLKHLEGSLSTKVTFQYQKVVDLLKFIHEKNLKLDIVKALLPMLLKTPNKNFESLLATVGYKKSSEKDILTLIPKFKKKYHDMKNSDSPQKENRWLMGKLKSMALGNIELKRLKSLVAGEST